MFILTPYVIANEHLCESTHGVWNCFFPWLGLIWDDVCNRWRITCFLFESIEDFQWYCFLLLSHYDCVKFSSSDWKTESLGAFMIKGKGIQISSTFAQKTTNWSCLPQNWTWTVARQPRIGIFPFITSTYNYLWLQFYFNCSSLFLFPLLFSIAYLILRWQMQSNYFITESVSLATSWLLI